MKIKSRWIRYFFGLEPAPAFVVVPTFALFMCVLIFTDKASIKRLKAHASDYGQRIRKMERQIPSFAMKDSVKPISFEYSFYSGKEEETVESEEGSNAFEREPKRPVSSSFVQMDDVEVDLASHERRRVSGLDYGASSGERSAAFGRNVQTPESVQGIFDSRSKAGAGLRSGDNLRSNGVDCGRGKQVVRIAKERVSTKCRIRFHHAVGNERIGGTENGGSKGKNQKPAKTRNYPC